MQRPIMIEMQPLESRRLLAFAPPTFQAPGWVSDPTIQADQKALADATRKLITDKRQGHATISTDQKAIRAELKELADDIGRKEIDDALQPLKEKLRADEKAKNKELRAAGEELRVAKREGTKLILADLKAWRQAVRSGDEDAADAAKKKLDATKTKVQADLKPIRDKIIAIKDKWRPIITADHDAIQAKLESLNPDLAPLYDKLDADADALTAKLTADQEAIKDAAEKLAADIKAWRDAHQDSAVA